MGKIIQKTILLFLLLSFSFCAFASHQQGTDLTYTCVSPGVYTVDLHFYRDCSGIAAATTYILTAKSPGCNTGRTFIMNRVGNPVLGNLYCNSVPSTCTASSQPNYEEYIYRTTVTFTAAEQACPDWVLCINFTDGNRPATANVSGSPVLYAESYLKLSAGINNNSAHFNTANVPVPLVNNLKPITIAFTASDPDGDSLAYKLIEPLVASNVPVGYKNYTLTTGKIQNVADTSQYAIVPLSGIYSAKFPLHSYLVNWAGSNPHTFRKYFELDSLTGQLTFIPAFYIPNTTSVSGLNKYDIAVQVSEFRKINGAYVKVGVITRDVLITLVDSGPNRNPEIAAVVANNLVLSNPRPIIQTNAGTPLTIQVTATDADASNALVIESNAATVMNGALMNVTSVPQPTVVITWTPAISQVRTQPYYFNVIVKDDACPVKGYHSETIGVRVNNAGAVTGATKDINTTLNLIAIPNPFSEEVSFKISAPITGQYISIYNALGQEIDKIAIENLTSPENYIPWKNAAEFSAGTYFARLINAGKSGQTIQFSKFR